MPRDSSVTADSRIEGPRFFETLWERIPAEGRESFTDEQRALLVDAARQCKFDTHPVDIRFSLPFLLKRFYFVVLAGPERRGEARRKVERARLPLLKLANLLFLIGSVSLGTLIGAAIFTPIVIWYLGS